MSRLFRIKDIRPKYVALLENADIDRLSKLATYPDLEALSSKTGIPLSDLNDLQKKAQAEIKSETKSHLTLSLLLLLSVGLVSFYATRLFFEEKTVDSSDSGTIGMFSDKLYREAFTAYDKQDYAMTLQLVEKGLSSIDTQDKQNHSNFLNLKGLVFDKQGQIDEALDYYQKAEAIDPSNPYPTNNIGAIAQLKGDLEKAESYYRQAIEKQTDIALFHSNLGVLLYRLDRFKEAIEQLKLATEIDPKNIDDRISLANAYLQNDQIDIAKTMYQALLAEGKADPNDMNYNLGLSFEREKQWDKAIEQYKKVAKTASIYPTTLNQLATAYAAKKDFATAVELQRQRVELDPKNISARNELANYLVEAEDFSSAIAEYQQVRTDEGEPKNYIEYNLGRAYMKNNQPEQAIQHFQAAVQLNPKDVDSTNYLGILYHQKKSYESALKYFKTATELLPEEAVYWYNLGLTYSDLKEFQKGIVFLNKAIAIDPTYAPAYNTLGFAYEQQKNYNDAVNFYQKAIELNPEVELYQNNLFNLLKYSFSAEAAQRTIASIIEKLPTIATFYLVQDRLLVNTTTLQQRILKLEKGIPIVNTPSPLQSALGSLYNEQGNYLRAAQYFQLAANNSSAPLQLHLNAGYAFQSAFKYQDSLKEFDQALMLAPDNWNARLNKGWLLLNMGNTHLPEARQIFEGMLNESKGNFQPNDKWLFTSMATLERLQGKPADKVLEWLNKAEEITPGDGLVAFYRAAAYEYFSNYTEAKQAYQLATQDPAQAEYAFNSLCNLYYSLDQFSEYQQCQAEFSVKVSPQNFNARLSRSWDLFYRGDLDSATKTAEDALTVFVDNPAFIASLLIFQCHTAILHDDKKTLKSLYLELSNLSQTYPYYPDLKIQLANLYRTDFDQAYTGSVDAVLKELEAEFNYDPLVQQELIAQDYQQGREQQALKRINQQLKFSPNNASLLLAKSRIKFMAGELSDSLALVEQVLNNSPDNIPGLILKVSYQLQTNNPISALQNLRKIQAIDRQFDMALGSQPWIFVHNKQPVIIKTQRQKRRLIAVLDDLLNNKISKEQIATKLATDPLNEAEKRNINNWIAAYYF